MARPTKKRLLKNCVSNSEKMRGTLHRKVGVILSGGNIDMGWMRRVLEGGVPEL